MLQFLQLDVVDDRWLYHAPCEYEDSHEHGRANDFECTAERGALPIDLVLSHQGLEMAPVLSHFDLAVCFKLCKVDADFTSAIYFYYYLLIRS